jgi:hypothetical protein
MGYDDRDVEKAVLKIARTPREEGETAFPDLGTLLDAVEMARRTRRNEEMAQGQADWERAREEDAKAHPEHYVFFPRFGELLKTLTAAIEAKKEEVR